LLFMIINKYSIIHTFIIRLFQFGYLFTEMVRLSL